MKTVALVSAIACMIAAGSLAPEASARQAGGGYYSQCIAHLANGTQIAVPNAKSYGQCTAAAARCVAGRPWVRTDFHSSLVLTSSNPVELCTES